MFHRYLLLAAFLFSALAHAASTTELSVTGLITPSACEPGLSDGAQMHPIGSSGPSTWAPTSILSPQYLTAFNPIETVTVPAPLQRLNADLQITPTIAPANTLPLTEEIPIDGSMTLTVKYL